MRSLALYSLGSSVLVLDGLVSTIFVGRAHNVEARLAMNLLDVVKALLTGLIGRCAHRSAHSANIRECRV